MERDEFNDFNQLFYVSRYISKGCMENSTCTFTKAFVLYYITRCGVISKFLSKIFTKMLIAFIKVASNQTWLTLSWRRPLSNRNQSTDLQTKLMDWFLYDNGLRHERVKRFECLKLHANFRWYQFPKLTR